MKSKNPVRSVETVIQILKWSFQSEMPKSMHNFFFTTNHVKWNGIPPSTMHISSLLLVNHNVIQHAPVGKQACNDGDQLTRIGDGNAGTSKKWPCLWMTIYKRQANLFFLRCTCRVQKTACYSLSLKRRKIIWRLRLSRQNVLKTLHLWLHWMNLLRTASSLSYANDMRKTFRTIWSKHYRTMLRYFHIYVMTKRFKKRTLTTDDKRLLNDNLIMRQKDVYKNKQVVTGFTSFGMMKWWTPQ